MKRKIQTVTHVPSFTIIAPGSKPLSQRAIILAALANGISEIKNLLVADDTEVILRSLQVLGVRIEKLADDHLLIHGLAGLHFKQDVNLHFAKSGVAARFLLMLVAANGGRYLLDADEQMRVRPLTPLVKLLKEKSVALSQDHFPLEIASPGHLPGGELAIASDISSQFLSAALIAAPFFQQDSLFKTRELISASYVTMTIALMQKFGVHVQPLSHAHLVKAGQSYQAQHITIEPDIAGSSYFILAALLLHGECRIKNFNWQTSLQGEKIFIDAIAKMGAKVLQQQDELYIAWQRPLQGISIDMHAASDTFITLAALAPFCSSPTTITGINHTATQESNRPEAVAMNLRKLGAQVELTAAGLTVYPGQLRAAIIDPKNDHRLAMAFSILGLCVPGVEILDAECVAKSFPKFYQVLEEIFYANVNN